MPRPTSRPVASSSCKRPLESRSNSPTWSKRLPVTSRCILLSIVLPVKSSKSSGWAALRNATSESLQAFQKRGSRRGRAMGWEHLVIFRIVSVRALTQPSVRCGVASRKAKTFEQPATANLKRHQTIGT